MPSEVTPVVMGLNSSLLRSSAAHAVAEPATRATANIEILVFENIFIRIKLYML
jgi:hypothetical protein